MARKNLKERQKKVEDLEDISADSEPDHDLDASENRKATFGKKGTEAEDEAASNSEEDQPEKEVKKKGRDSTEKKQRKRKETEPEDEATTNSEEDQPEKEVKKKGRDSTEKKQRKRKETEPEDEGTTNSDEDQPENGVEKKGSDSTEKKRRKRKGEAHHPPTIDMVLEALMYLDNRKGVSIPAMKDYIMTQNTIRPENLKHLLRKALVKLLGKETIIRPKGEENKSVLLGRYKIAPKKDVKPEKPRERPSSLRKLGGGGGKIKKTKKKKRKRSGYY